MIWGRLSTAAAFLLALSIAAPVARADDPVATLTKTLTSSSNDKTRLAAVVALAKLGDKRALKPLVTALHDPSSDVRAAAAIALGHLGHKASLPSLHELAANDPDDSVRAKAKTAATMVAKANHITEDADKPAPRADGGDRFEKTAEKSSSSQHPPRDGGFGRSPHAVENHPDMYIVVKTSSDDSPGKADKATRKVHADIIRDVLMDSFKAQPSVTTLASEAKHWDLVPRQVDLSVVKLEVTTVGANMEIEAQLRLAISDDKGSMQSFLSGGAKVTVSKAKFDAKYLPELQREALDNAMRGMFDKLLAHLRKTSQS